MVNPSWFPPLQPAPLPELIINTDNNDPIISKTDYISGQYTLKENDLDTSQGALSIRGRGNSTWTWPKKPYRIQLNQSASLLNMAANKNWVLLANYADKTLMRNDLAFTLSRLMGFEYTVADRYVTLKLNGQYEGIYQLAENIRISKNRLNIDELKLDDVDSSTISGGYLIELDLRMAHPDGGINPERATTYCVDSSKGMSPMCIQNPDDLHKPERQAQRDYITQHLKDFENALFSENFTDPTLGYRAYIDADSAINYYLINEFFKNVEGGKNSFYLYKKRDGKLFFGPVWDFDIAMGSNWFSEGQNPEGWVIRQDPWFAQLLKDPTFASEVSARWFELKNAGVFDDLLRYARARANWLAPHKQENFTRWPLQGNLMLWLRDYEDHPAELNKLLNFVQTRYQWLDRQFALTQKEAK